MAGQIDERRRAVEIVQKLLRREDWPDPVESGSHRHVAAHRTREILEGDLGRARPRQRIAGVLFDLEGYSHREIAQVVNVSEGTVRSDVFHARRALREALAAWHGMKEES